MRESIPAASIPHGQMRATRSNYDSQIPGLESIRPIYKNISCHFLNKS